MFQQRYGKFENEAGGHVSGHIIHVDAPRRDGKYKVTHVFGSGKRVIEILTRENLEAAIAKVQS